MSGLLPAVGGQDRLIAGTAQIHNLGGHYRKLATTRLFDNRFDRSFHVIAPATFTGR